METPPESDWNGRVWMCGNLTATKIENPRIPTYFHIYHEVTADFIHDKCFRDGPSLQDTYYSYKVGFLGLPYPERSAYSDLSYLYWSLGVIDGNSFGQAIEVERLSFLYSYDLFRYAYTAGKLEALDISAVEIPHDWFARLIQCPGLLNAMLRQGADASKTFREALSTLDLEVWIPSPEGGKSLWEEILD